MKIAFKRRILETKMARIALELHGVFAENHRGFAGILGGTQSFFVAVIASEAKQSSILLRFFIVRYPLFFTAKSAKMLRKERNSLANFAVK